MAVIPDVTGQAGRQYTKQLHTNTCDWRSLTRKYASPTKGINMKTLYSCLELAITKWYCCYRAGLWAVGCGLRAGAVQWISQIISVNGKPNTAVENVKGYGKSFLSSLERIFIGNVIFFIYFFNAGVNIWLERCIGSLFINLFHWM